MRFALATHDFAAVFHLLCTHSSIRRKDIAHSWGVTAKKVRHVINRRYVVTSYAEISAIADGLRIPGERVGFTPRPWEIGQDTKRRVSLLRRWRECVPWTRAEMAAAINAAATRRKANVSCHVSNIYRWEHTTRTAPHPVYCRLLEDVTGLTIDQLGFQMSRSGEL
ncbi:hypothetical protein [Murinocardiopsis flavida]|uniref:hypothetical protein n=1 Tax=Murinocardiopsis flavida TaxID=645275 RepID=UPI001B800DD4|nr:hypothetical protein [Murinocardiopsis flavida]